MKARRWAPIVFGVTVFVVFVGISAVVLSVAWFREHMTIEAATGTSADAAFDDIRQRFRDKAPLLEMHGSAVARRNPPDAEAPRTSLTTMHVLAWDAREEKLARFEIPFWFVRLKETPIHFGTYATGLDDLKVSLTAAEVERYGPGIIVDIERSGRDRALLWVE
jgi:hypothetical protein